MKLLHRKLISHHLSPPAIGQWSQWSPLTGILRGPRKQHVSGIL